GASGAWALERLNLFQRLPAADLAALACEDRVLGHAKRATILLEEDDSLVWFVLQGGIKLCRLSAFGTRLIEAILLPGDPFGRISSARHGSIYEIQCLEATT